MIIQLKEVRLKPIQRENLIIAVVHSSSKVEVTLKVHYKGILCKHNITINARASLEQMTTVNL